MPDFTAQVDLAASTNASIAAWSDPATGSLPSRLNPNPAHVPSYVKIIASPGAAHFEAYATVGGAAAPVDGALGGRLFQWSWVEWDGSFPPALSTFAAQTSRVQCTIPVGHLGHFALLCRRDGGGGVILHFDSE